MNRAVKSRADLIAEAKRAYVELFGTDPDDPNDPAAVEGYELVALFSSEQVNVMTDQYGDMKVTFKVPRAQKYAVLPATDYPSLKLYVRVMGPRDVPMLGGDQLRGG